MWDIANIAILAIPIGIISFWGCGYLSFYLAARGYLTSQISFVMFIVTLVLIPIFVPFRLDINLMIALWSIWIGAVILFGYFLILFLIGVALSR